MANEALPADVVVIGGGPGGYVASIRAAQLGLSTVCVEMDRTLGGTCVNVGCIPSKALLQSSEHFEFARLHAGEHVFAFYGLRLDLTQMMRRKDEVVLQNTRGPVVYVVKGDRATLRAVQRGANYEGQVEITSGLAAGDSVVVAGNTRLRDGAAVRVVPPAGGAPVPSDVAPRDTAVVGVAPRDSTTGGR